MMRTRRLATRTTAAWAAALLWAAAPAGAATLTVTVTDADGDPVADAVVTARPLGADGRVEPSPEPAVIDQVDKEYVPYVTAVRKGTRVSFPNSDPVRHHVYSFSDTKTFEIPLYKGTPPEPIVFEKPGVVPLGCNIHDWMKAYVFVTETPHFGVTGEDGRVALEGLAARRYRVEVWHPELKGSREATAQEVSVESAGASASVAIERKRVWRPRRAPSAGGAGYN